MNTLAPTPGTGGSLNEVISETEDETQGALLHMPNLKPSSDELLAELEQYVAIIKESRARDLEESERIETLILRYKAVRNEEKKKATAALSSQLTPGSNHLWILRVRSFAQLQPLRDSTLSWQLVVTPTVSHSNEVLSCYYLCDYCVIIYDLLRITKCQ